MQKKPTREHQDGAQEGEQEDVKEVRSQNGCQASAKGRAGDEGVADEITERMRKTGKLELKC